MEMLLDSFLFSNVNYCSLEWHFSSAVLSQKTEKTQERALRLLHKDCYPNYKSWLLKTEWPTVEVTCLQELAIEAFKTLKAII